MSADATCYGFAAEPAIPFAYGRGGAGEPLAIEIADGGEPANPGELVRTWEVAGPEPFFAGLYADHGAFRLWADDSGWFEIQTSPPRIALPANGNDVKREERLWGIPVLMCFAARGDTPLHAAAVDIGGSAILLAAPGRFGKTTLSAGFVRHGYRLLSEDLCCIRVGATCLIVPGPAMLRIRADVADRLAIPGAAVLDAGDDRVHLALDPTQRGDCTPVPIRALLFLHGGADTVNLEPVPSSEAVRSLFALIFRLPGTAETERAFSAAATIAAHVPAWNLTYPFGLDRLEQVVEAVTTRLAG